MATKQTCSPTRLDRVVATTARAPQAALWRRSTPNETPVHTGVVGLDIYAGPVTRYVLGNWLTIVQQAGQAGGLNVEVIRANENPNAVRDPAVVSPVVQAWQDGIVRSLGASIGWEDSVDVDYATDKPDWDGYGAVLLLAAFDERPDLAPGTKTRAGLRRTKLPDVAPRNYADSPAFEAARGVPTRYPTLLLGAEWCLPIAEGPSVFQAPTPNGHQTTMGRVDNLLEELNDLNDRTVRLAPADLAAARKTGPPPPGAKVKEVVPFGLSVLLSLAEYASVRRVPWIMDY